MNTDYCHRIAPIDHDYVCQTNERLVQATDDRASAGATPDGNYTLYIEKDYEVVASEVYAFIEHAKGHPELRFIVRFYGMDFARVDRLVLVALFARAREVENILLTEDCWRVMDQRQIVNHEGIVSWAGVVKVPVMVKYRIFSNSIRYGVARSVENAAHCYFAVHGCPSRNDDYFTIARVSEREYDEMVRVYEPLGSQSGPTAERFCDEYVKGRALVYEGWDLPDVLWV